MLKRETLLCFLFVQGMGLLLDHHLIGHSHVHLSAYTKFHKLNKATFLFDLPQWSLQCLGCLLPLWGLLRLNSSVTHIALLTVAV
jgi:hypothetical protein